VKALRLLAILLLHTTLSAQKTDREQFIKDSTELMKIKLARPQLKFDNRLTFYEGQSLSINGIDAGVLLKDKLRLTLGFYRLNDDLNLLSQTIDSLDVKRHIKIQYAALNTEIMYLDKRYFALGLPLEIGIGYSHFKTTNAKRNEVLTAQSGLLAMAHFGLSATFKPIRWIGLKGMLGYRKTIFNQVSDFQFDGLFTSLGLNIDFREVIRDVKMMRLKKKYKRGNPIENAVDIITD